MKNADRQMHMPENDLQRYFREVSLERMDFW